MCPCNLSWHFAQCVGLFKQKKQKRSETRLERARSLLCTAMLNRQNSTNKQQAIGRYNASESRQKIEEQRIMDQLMGRAIFETSPFVPMATARRVGPRPEAGRSSWVGTCTIASGCENVCGRAHMLCHVAPRVAKR